MIRSLPLGASSKASKGPKTKVTIGQRQACRETLVKLLLALLLEVHKPATSTLYKLICRNSNFTTPETQMLSSCVPKWNTESPLSYPCQCAVIKHRSGRAQTHSASSNEIFIWDPRDIPEQRKLLGRTLSSRALTQLITEALCHFTPTLSSGLRQLLGSSWWSPQCADLHQLTAVAGSSILSLTHAYAYVSHVYKHVHLSSRVYNTEHIHTQGHVTAGDLSESTSTTTTGL